MVLLTFRLTDDNREMLDSAVVFARTTAVVSLAVFEISKQDKAHIHMLFETKNTKSAWVQSFHKYFKNRWVGNKSYSCSELEKDKENFYIYCCKGTRFKGPDVLFKLAELTDDQIEIYWKKYWEDKPIENDKTISVKTKKTRDPTWSELLTQTIQIEYPNRNWDYDATDVDLLWNIVMKHLGSQSKKLNTFIVRDLVMGQLNALTYGSCKKLNVSMKNQAFPDLFGC